MTEPHRRLRNGEAPSGADRAPWRPLRGPRAVLLVVLAVVGLVVTAGPAAADPARPTHYRATVTGVYDAAGQPLPAFAAGGLEVEVLGGDAFLVVRAAPGTTVAVPGYEDEPYLRVGGDGTVEVNVRSPAWWLNDARYGARDVQVPPQADAQAPPVWEVVADDGTYAWHDHRIHVMSPALPSQIDPAAGTVQRVWDTVVPLQVDGQPAEVRIDLDWVPGPSPFVAALLPVVLAVALSALVLVRAAAAPAALVVVCAGALGVGVASWLATPAGGDVEPALVVLPVLALVLLALGRGVARRGAGAEAGESRTSGRVTPGHLSGWLDAGAAVPLAVWGIVLAPSFVRPIVPGPLPVWVVRGVTAAALAAGVAVGVLVVRRLLGPPRPASTG